MTQRKNLTAEKKYWLGTVLGLNGTLWN
jgi:hypothetical protein